MEQVIGQGTLAFRFLKLCNGNLRNHHPTVRTHFTTERLLDVTTRHIDSMAFLIALANRQMRFIGAQQD